VRFLDLVRTAFASLAQHKLRNTLTLIGVVIGTSVLMLSLSVQTGVYEAAMRELRKHDQLRKIQVYTSYQAEEKDVPVSELEVTGEMSDEKRERIRQAKVRRWSSRNVRKPQTPLTRERLRAIEQLEHVESVTPYIQRDGRTSLGGKTEDILSAGAPLGDTSYAKRLVAGEYFRSVDAQEVLVSEFLLYRLDVKNDADVAEVVGKKIRLESRPPRQAGFMLLYLLQGNAGAQSPEESRVLDKVVHQLPNQVPKFDLTDEERATLQTILARKPSEPNPIQEPPYTEEFTIVGVVREVTQEEIKTGWGLERMFRDADLIMPAKTAEDLAFRSPSLAKSGVDGATVTVKREDDLKQVAGQIKEMGFQQYSLAEFVDNVRTNIRLLSFATGFLALVALLVAAIGIINTMLMSVLERTHEIGVMKAVGARDRHIQFLFLVEGALIGAAGGALGLLVSWLASIPGDAYARKVMAEQTGAPVEESLFLFPLTITLGVPVFACLVTTVAALYPARRAARVNPIVALRHE
jgi:putative ABC transport system permease protein